MHKHYPGEGGNLESMHIYFNLGHGVISEFDKKNFTDFQVLSLGTILKHYSSSYNSDFYIQILYCPIFIFIYDIKSLYMILHIYD